MENIVVSRPRPGVILITLDRPQKRNALSIALLAELARSLSEADRDDAVRCVVLTGTNARSPPAPTSTTSWNGASTRCSPRERLAAWEAVQEFSKPLIAAVDGYALGGGCELAMLCDIIVAGEKARFGQPEINIGIFPGDGATQRLPRAVGKSMAMKLVLTGEMIDAATAKSIGLVAEVTADGETVPRALDLARLIAEKSPTALRLAKQSVLKAFETSLAEGLAFERRNLALAFEGEDQKEGMAAFVEKRKPRFRGR